MHLELGEYLTYTVTCAFHASKVLQSIGVWRMYGHGKRNKSK